MTGKNDDAESDPIEETPESPNSESSNDNGAKPTSPSDAEALWKQFKPFISKELRELQSNKDSRIGKLESTVKAFEPVLERVKDLIPADKFQALQRDLEFEDLKRRVYGDESETESSDSDAGKRPNTAAGEVAKVVDSVLKLPPNDPRVTDLKTKFGDDPTAYLSEALKLYARIGEAAEDEATPGEGLMSSVGKSAPKNENPIANIEDPKTLYRMAARQMAQSHGKKRKVPS